MVARNNSAKNTSVREFVILMAALMSIVSISIDAMLPALGVIGHDLGLLNPNHAQYIIGSIFLGMTIGQLIGGPLSDDIGRKKILYVGLFIYFIGSIICYISGSLEMILIGRLVQGIGISGPNVAATAIVRDKYSGRDMARIMSFVMMIFMLMPAMAPAMGQGILIIASWRVIFLMYMVYSVILLVWLFLRLEETLSPENRIKFSSKNLVHGFKEIVSNRTTACYTICMGICFGGLIGFLTSAQQIFQVHFQTGKMFVVYFAMLALMIAVASFVNSGMVQRLGMRHICKRAMIAIIVISAIFLTLNFTIEIPLWMFMVYSAALFFSFGIMFGNLNAIAMEPMGHIAGIASALIGSTSFMMSLVLGSIIGQLYDNTLVPLASGFLVLGILSLFFMWLAEGKKLAAE